MTKHPIHILLLCSLAIGCSTESPDESMMSKIHFKENFPTPNRGTENTDFLLNPLRESCSRAGGHLPATGMDAYRCVCPSEDGATTLFFDISENASTPKCTAFEKTAIAGCFSQSSSLRAGVPSDSALNSCLHDLVTNSSRVSLAFSVAPATSAEDRAKLRDWAFAQYDQVEGGFATPLWPRTGPVDGIRVEFGKKKLDEQETATVIRDHFVKRPLVSKEFMLQGDRGYQKSLFVPSFESLDIALGRRQFLLGQAVPPPSVSHRKKEQDLFAAMRALAEFKPRRGTLDSGQSCLDLCTLRSRSEEGVDWSAWRERVYAGGVVVRDVAFFVDKSNRASLRGAISYGMSGEPMLYLITEEAWSESQVTNAARLYDSNWNELGTTYLSLSGINLANMTISTLPTIDQAQDGEVVAVCDSGFDPRESRLPHPVAVRGPALAQWDRTQRRFNGSLHGWLPNPEGNLLKFLDGFRDQELGILGTWDGSSRHGLDVAEIIAEQGDLKVASLSSACFETWAEWRTTTKVGEATRTVNLSFAFPPNSPGLCEEVAGQVLDESNKDLLWVMAAGNDAWPSPINRCPQGLQKRGNSLRKNVLVVAGTSWEFNRWEFSNGGKDYADIAAEVANLTGTDKGTSYSAPRVAKVAARIAKRHPELSPADIANAILMGAKIPRNGTTLKPLDWVRGGGVLFEERALRVAESLAKIAATNRGSKNALAGSLESALRTEGVNESNSRTLSDETFFFLGRNGAIR